jgi:hypothetical protein
MTMTAGVRGTAERHAPVRTCVGCRQRRLAASLVRLGVDGDGVVRVGKAPTGRGAWLCADPACLAAATRSRSFGRAFRRPPSALVVAVEPRHLLDAVTDDPQLTSPAGAISDSMTTRAQPVVGSRPDRTRH